MTPTMTSPILSAGTLIGDPVRSPTGETLGRIKEFMIDTRTGRIVYAVLSVGGFLGLGDKLFAIPWARFRVNPEERCFLLDVEKERFENAEGFDPDQWPDMDDERWASRVHAYFGSVTP